MKFSARTVHGDAPNRIAQELRRLQEQRRTILDLTQSNPTVAGFTYPGQEILAGLSGPAVLRYEPSPQGLLAAREAVAGYLGQHVKADRIVLVSSTSEAYSYLFKLLCDPGEAVLAPRPSYPLFEVLARLEGIGMRQYLLRYDYGWRIDFGSLAVAGAAGARAVLVVNPNNPTGSFLNEPDRRELIDFCRQKELALICDEVFLDYAFGDRRAASRPVAGCEDVLTFTLSGLSKVSALPQMKLAWIAVSGPEEQAAEALERLEWIADSFLSPGAPAQCGAGALLAARHPLQAQIRARTARNLGFLQAQLTGLSATVLNVEGGWYAVLRVPNHHSEEEWVLELLRQEGVLLQPGYFYDFDDEAYLVLSLLTETHVFDAGVEAILRLLRRWEN